MIVHNGDHLEYEIENANAPPKERSDWPLPSFDARDWAEAFRKTATKLGYSDMDEGWLISWFASSLIRGFDEHASRSSKQLNLDVRCEHGCTLNKVNAMMRK